MGRLRNGRLMRATRPSASAMVGIALCLSVAVTADAQSTQFYDARGRYSGSARESHGTTSFYDASGRFTGSARTQNGTTQFYDDRGRFTGSARESPTGTTVYDSRGAYDGSARTTQGRTSSYEPSSENLSCTLPAPMICMP